jgi:hypothetical protein
MSESMGTSKVSTNSNAQKQENQHADVEKKNKKPFKLTIATKEELESIRIPVYPYMI